MKTNASEYSVNANAIQLNTPKPKPRVVIALALRPKYASLVAAKFKGELIQRRIVVSSKVVRFQIVADVENERGGT